MKFQHKRQGRPIDYQTRLRSYTNKVRHTLDVPQNSMCQQSADNSKKKISAGPTKVHKRTNLRKQIQFEGKMVKTQEAEKNSQQLSSSGTGFLENITNQCMKVFNETISSKYFSRKIYQRITNDSDAPKMRLKQDQKKSLECNLIYNILKYLNWTTIFNFLKKNRNKVKILKVSTFKEYILNGQLFQNEPDKTRYTVTKDMVEKAVTKLEKISQLYHFLFEKKIYKKLMDQDVEKYKEKMVVFVYKIIQFTQLMKKEHENLEHDGSQSHELDITQILREGELRGNSIGSKGRDMAMENITTNQLSTQSLISNYTPGSFLQFPLILSNQFIQPESLMASFERNETEMQQNSIQTPDIDEDSKKNLQLYQIDNT